ncbi:hypothetical protein CDD83_6452 [Cordyceps sp. RAO-2017]|nr:hypothetical protein CDD83_6452 [Cordyceps sp. RAO-2017]
MDLSRSFITPDRCFHKGPLDKRSDGGTRNDKSKDDLCGELLAGIKREPTDDPGVYLWGNDDFHPPVILFPAPSGQCVNIAQSWDNAVSAITPNSLAGVCSFYTGHDCSHDTRAFKTSYPGVNLWGRSGDSELRQFNDRISSFRCDCQVFEELKYSVVPESFNDGWQDVSYLAFGGEGKVDIAFNPTVREFLDWRNIRIKAFSPSWTVTIESLDRVEILQEHVGEPKNHAWKIKGIKLRGKCVKSHAFYELAKFQLLDQASLLSFDQADGNRTVWAGEVDPQNDWKLVQKDVGNEPGTQSLGQDHDPSEF